MPQGHASLSWWELALGDFCFRTVAVTGVTHSPCFCYVTPSMPLDTGAGEGREALFCVFNTLISPFLPAPGTTVALLGPLCGFRETREGGPASGLHQLPAASLTRVTNQGCVFPLQGYIPNQGPATQRRDHSYPCPKLLYLLFRFGHTCSQSGFVVLFLR